MIIRLLKEENASTLDIINAALNSPTKDGLSVEVILARGRVDRVLEALPADATQLEVNDAQYATIQAAAKGLLFSGRSVIVKTFVEDISQEVADVKGEA